MKKILLILGLGLLGFIVLVSIIIGFYLGPLIKIGIQEIGPKITKVAVTVDAVDVSLLTGSAQIKGLVIGNPAGYQMPQAIRVGRAFVSMAPFSVFSKKVIIHSVDIEAPEITFEGGLTGNNLRRIVKNTTAVSQNPRASAQAMKGPHNQPAPNLEVDNFIISKAKVHVSVKGVGGAQLTVPLPDIHLINLGKEGNGITPVALTRAVLTAITTETITAVAANSINLTHHLKKLQSNSVDTIVNTIGSLLGK